ncbi:MAG TPA: SOS response-associated peptidase family protein, partial [Vineibacter sp.]|nr:SOS response-associated peptidase family protein [Vineibacter sp.]
TKSQDAMRRLFRVTVDHTGNQPALPAIFPDQLAPVVRASSSGREALMMRWGFPPPPKLGTRPITNVRNTQSGYWKAWLKPEYRCLVPATSFCEYTDSIPKVAHWFALDESRPLFAFAGIWRPWTGTRGTKKEPVDGEHLLFSFLITDSNADVRPVHAKAMPVILTTADAFDTWLTAPVEVALALQQPLPQGVLQVVAQGKREDVVDQAA